MTTTTPDRFKEGTFGAPNAKPNLIPLPDDRNDPSRTESIKALLAANGFKGHESAWAKFAKSIFVMP